MKRIAWTVLLAALLVPTLNTDAGARDKITILSYNVGIPVGNTEDYISETSFRGFGLDFRHFRSRGKNFTVGFTFAWQVFDQRATGTTVLDNGAVTGTQRRFLNTLPFLLTSHWYSSQQNNRTRIYIGAGAGTYYIEQRLDIGVSSFQENNWHFGLMGEAGIQIPLGDVELVVGARYNYAFAAGQSIGGDGQDWDYVTAIAGLAWSRW
jgi:opacity protein-like surface antigen